MDSWWQLGEDSGYYGNDLEIQSIECAFCGERGNWELVNRSERKKPNAQKKLFFDTYKCGNCASFVMVFWSFGHGFHAYKVVPWPLKLTKYPEYLPENVGRYWLQAHKNLNDENWDAAAVMARSALQIALRENGATGKTLRDEIRDLANKGQLPPLMRDWSDNVRLLGNVSAHPTPGDPPIEPSDASDVTHFLDFLVEYLYDLPRRIDQYRTPEDE